MRRPAQKRRGERPQEPAKASTQNRANTPKSLTAQMEPRYYGQVPFRGCSLMVKPQSSKLITRVRFPSSPPLQRLRRKRWGLLRSRDDGNRFRLKVPKAFETFRLQPVIPSRTILNESIGIPSACGFVSSRARNPHAPARHPLHKILFKVAGNRLRAKIHSLARSGFSPSSPSSPRTN